MKSTTCILMSALLIGIGSGAGAATAPAATPAKPTAGPAKAGPSNEARIRALEARFVDAVRAKNVNAIMRVYAPDVFVFDVVPPRQYVGAAAYRKDWQGYVEHFKGQVKFDVSDLRIIVSGDMAYSHSIQTISGVDAKGTSTPMTVRVTDVYRKHGGAWKIVQEHVSVPVDLDTDKPDLTSAP
ncbi:MAG: YybH family protein [Caulobacteraceae bacterium]